MKKTILSLLFVVATYTIFGLQLLQIGQARTEEVLDNNNNDLKISMEAPNDWNSGKISATTLNVDWKLNWEFATNSANNLLGSGQEALSFFAIINAPSVVNPSIPFIVIIMLLTVIANIGELGTITTKA